MGSVVSFSDSSEIIYYERPMASTKQKCTDDINSILTPYISLPLIFILYKEIPQIRSEANIGKALITASVLLQRPSSKKMAILFTAGNPTDDIKASVAALKVVLRSGNKKRKEK
jgi:hypothetical protein